MADYQSLLTRAVANLPSTGSATTRQAIYDRARNALVTQLRSLRPPLPDSDIEREKRALDAAIAVVESQFSSNPDPRAAEPAPGPRTAQSRSDAPTSADPAELASPVPSVPAAGRVTAAPAHVASSRPSAPLRPSVPASVTPASAPHAPLAAQKPTQPPAAPRGQAASTPVQPTQPGHSDAPFQRRPAAPPSFSPVAHGPRESAGAASAPIVRVGRNRGPEAGASAPPVMPAKANGESAALANLANVVPSNRAEHTDLPVAPAVIAGRTNEAETFVAAPQVPADIDSGSAPRLESEGQRPFAPTATAQKRPSWPWLVLAVVVGVVLSVAVAAILMRQKPQDLAITPPAEHQQEAQAPAKIAQRAQPSSPAEEHSAASAPSASEPQGGQAEQAAGAPTEPQNAALPTAARAAVLIASADNPQKPVVNLGSSVWSTIPAAQGQPATVAVKAEADIPDLKMHATMIMRKNIDPTLEATHTIDLKFAFADGAPIVGFKDVGLPQMRKLDSTASETLNSVKVKISDVYFLIALAKGDQELARNLDLMRTHAWFDFPLLLNDDRIAKLVFQKSAEGEAMLEKAFEAWK